MDRDMRVDPTARDQRPTVQEPSPRIVMARETTMERPMMRPLRDDQGLDLMRWGSLWGGLFMFIAFASALGAVAIAIGGFPTAITPAVGTTIALVLLASTFLASLLAGWTSNIRTIGPALVNGIVFASILLSVPVVVAFITAAFVAAPGGVSFFSLPIGLIQSNIGLFTLGTLLTMAVAAAGYYLGTRAHRTALLKREEHYRNM